MQMDLLNKLFLAIRWCTSFQYVMVLCIFVVTDTANADLGCPKQIRHRP